MKEENHVWLQNIFDYLASIGLGHIVSETHLWDHKRLKAVVTCRLQDMYIQKYEAYRKDITNESKCKVNNIITPYKYEEGRYLNIVKDPATRSIFTKLRTDSNISLDCKLRSFRFKGIVSDTCKTCKCTQDVTHIMFKCLHPELIGLREKFLKQYSIYSAAFCSQPITMQLKEILGIIPKCALENVNDACNLVIAYTKNVYKVLERNN